MIRKIPENIIIEESSKSGDWIFNHREKDTRVILSANYKPGLHIKWGEERPLSQSYEISPHGLDDELKMSRHYHCINLIDSSRNKLAEILNLNRLRLTEHFFALRPLLQIFSLEMTFPDGAVPYSVNALTKTTKKLIENLTPFSEDKNFYLTPKYSFRIQEGDTNIYMESKTEPGLDIEATFDYTGFKKLAWLGQGKAEFHTNLSNPLDFVNTPSPIMHDVYNLIFKLLHNVDFSENFLTKKEADLNPELIQAVFRHKILDLLGALNIGHHLLAARIYMYKSSHSSHIALREQIKKIGLKAL